MTDYAGRFHNVVGGIPFGAPVGNYALGAIEQGAFVSNPPDNQSDFFGKGHFKVTGSQSSATATPTNTPTATPTDTRKLVAAAGFLAPSAIAADSAGDVYFPSIKETPNGNGYVSFPIDFSGLSFLQVAADDKGDVFGCTYPQAGTGAVEVDKLTPGAGTYTRSVVASGLATASPSTPLYELGLGAAVAADRGGDVYISDSKANRVVKETPSGDGYVQSVVAYGLDYSPYNVVADRGGDVYVTAQDDGGRVLKETPSGSGYEWPGMSSTVEHF